MRVEALRAGEDVRRFFLYQVDFSSARKRLHLRLEAVQEYTPSGKRIATSRTSSGMRDPVRVFSARDGSQRAAYVGVLRAKADRLVHVVTLTGARSRQAGVSAVLQISRSLRPPRLSGLRRRCKFPALATALAALARTEAKCPTWLPAEVQLESVFGSRAGGSISMSVNHRPPHVVLEWVRDEDPPGRLVAEDDLAEVALPVYFNPSSSGSPGLHSDHYIVVTPTTAPAVKLWVSVHAPSQGLATKPGRWSTAMRIVRSLQLARA